MAAAAIPALIKVGAAVGGSLLGKKLSGPSKTQQAGTAQTQQAATDLGTAGKSTLASAAPMFAQGADATRSGTGYLNAAGGYYKNILSGNRSAMANAVAPEMTSIMDYYKGAAGKANATLRGGSRDYANAELDRQKVGNMAMVLPQARAAAASGATSVGSNFFTHGANLNASGNQLLGTGGQMLTNSGLTGGNLFQQGTDQRNQQGESGKAYGGMIYDILSSLPFGKKGQAGSGQGEWGG